ncbi:DUF1405 domain-containing protein [Rubeoparvulum massiliense]|uniref:DUF1405 domain-containing protein n=1 Tax=Rubeoparvulum massiliense TaxID=1631346 RepID=UPI00069F7130|nr:DUF1405 domain-containing protein [Rubeoparvulum massiliense]
MKREAPLTGLWEWFQIILVSRPILILLFIINFLGSIYGFIWYDGQLQSTEPTWLRIFVPDSPTASTAFTLVLFSFLVGKRNGYVEAFAAVTSFKYGIWAIAAILWGGQLGSTIVPVQYMLMFSHAGMALEAVLYARYYIFKSHHLVAVAIWTLSNDLLDYLLNIHPAVVKELEVYDHLLGIFTVCLSLVSLILFWYLMKRRNDGENAITSGLS